MRAGVTVNIPKIRYNADIIIRTCAEKGIDVAAVTKMHSADAKISKALTDSGIKYLADSRIENLKKLKEENIPAERWLMRITAPSIVKEVVEYSDLSFQSELSTVRLIDDECHRIGRNHKIMLMWDLGDLREGYFETEDILSAVRAIDKMDGVILSGLGTNLSCYGGVKPTYKNLSRLVEVAGMIENETGKKLEQKYYSYHTGYVGGLKQIGYDKLMKTRPDFVVKKAVKGMLPKNSLGRAMADKLFVYCGAEHKQQAQQPVELKLD